MRIFLENKRNFLLLILLFTGLLIIGSGVFFRIKNTKDVVAPFEAPLNEQKRHAFLLNISEEQFVNYFGQPALIYNEGKNSMIQYRNDECIMSIYFVRNRQGKKISKKVLFRERQTLKYQESCKESFNVASFSNN